MMVNALLTLLYHYLPGSLSFWPAPILFSLSAIAPLLVSRVNPTPRPQKNKVDWGLAVVLLVALLFRLPDLGYSEFQGDEGIILTRAAAALTGDDAELFLHQKGPVEILLPMATWALNGALDEFWARLPFAWAGLLGVATLYQLGRRRFGPAGALAAALLLAINGFHIAFSRIVQYQNVVVWMALLSLLVLDEYCDDKHPVDLVLGAAFLAFGALAHYDAVLFAPAAGLLALCWKRGQFGRFGAVNVRHLLVGLAVGAVVLGLFYIPFALNPNFGKTAEAIGGGRVGSGPAFNLEKNWTMSTVYNSSYYVILLGLLVIGALGAAWQFLESIPAWLTFLVPFCFYMFVVADPRTHIYTFYPGAALLSGATISVLWSRIKGSIWRWGMLVSSASIYIFCAGYVWIAFVSHVPEYQRTWPEHQSKLYWTTYDEMPAYGRFGFPHRAGWHAVAALIADGTIAGRYASNEEQEITDFYTAQSPRTHCPKPDVYIVAERVQDEVAIDWGELEREYRLTGTVTVSGEPRIRWYTRDAAGDAGASLAVDQADYRQWWTPQQVVPPTTGGEHPVYYLLNDEIELIGCDLRATEARPGGWIEVTLYWRPLVPLTRNYQAFVHLYDDKQERQYQHDSAPECAVMPTTRWEPGQVIPDPHLVFLPPDASLGSLPVWVGMYDLLTLDRLPVPDQANNIIPLTEIEVRNE